MHVFTVSWAMLAAVILAIAAAQPKPNIIFMILDDQQSTLLGSGIDVMPRYKQHFQEEGMQFTNAFAATPKCCPSRTSLLSGKFAHNLQDETLGWCGDFISKARYNSTFIANVKDAGYTTGFFGKMVNSMGPMCDPKQRTVPTGFNVSDGDKFVAMCNEVVYYHNTFNVDGALFTTGGPENPSNYLQAFIGNQTIPWLTTVSKASAKGGKPFFAYLAPHAPHFPAEPAPWYANAPLPSDVAPRLPSFNNYTEGKIWAIKQNPPFDKFTTNSVDLHYRNRQRSLMSVDDYVAAIVDTLSATTGVLENTYIFATSDHGYHLGEYRLPFEKSLPYDSDSRVPFFVRGPGVAANVSQPGMVSLMDVGATIMELSGAVAPGVRTTDGRSLVPLLKAGGGAAPGWRNGLLVEHLGEQNQWMNMCGWVFNATCPTPAAKDPPYPIDGPQNTWAMFRLINATADLALIAFRPISTDPTAANTNWTEAYNLATDPYQGDNIAGDPLFAPLHALLFNYTACSLDSCP